MPTSPRFTHLLHRGDDCESARDGRLRRIGARALAGVRWPFGVLATLWEYVSRTRDVRRTEGPGTVPENLPPPLPPGVVLSDLQDVADGVGPLLHRCYVTRVRESELTAAALIDAFAGQPNRAAPQQLADFDKDHGKEGELRVGDEFTIHIPGPWDGPVRVIEVDSTGFGFVTLDGHLEAGRIRFSARDIATGCLELRIEAWARGGDRVSNMLFDRIGISKEVQLHTWVSVLARLTDLTGGRRDGAIHAATKRVAAAHLQAHSTGGRRGTAARSERRGRYAAADVGR